MTDACHPINVVAHRTGLTPYVIRIWEQRYGAVKPDRTASNRRLYTEQEVERLTLLRAVTQAGHQIGLVAKWSTEKLREQAFASTKATGPARRAAAAALPPGETLIGECVTAMQALNATALHAALQGGAVALGTMGLLQQVVAPLTQRIGELWVAGRITIAHEHLATAVLRTFLLNAARPFAENLRAPRLLVATPAGQLHELGALLVGAAATQLGWQIVYLGASLPAAEIAGAARQTQARAVALSLVYPEDDAQLPGELKSLREMLPADVAIVAGGRAVPAYCAALDGIGARPVSDLAELATELAALRQPAPALRPVRPATPAL